MSNLMNDCYGNRKYSRKVPQMFKENNNGTFTGDHFVYEYLKDGASIDMNVDGSVTPVVFDYLFTSTHDSIQGLWIETINFLVMNDDISLTNFFGEPILTNGVTIQALDKDLAVLTDFTDNAPFARGLDFNTLIGAGSFELADGILNDDTLSLSWKFSNSNTPLFLKDAERIRITINDDLTGMTEFKAMLHGIY